MRGLGASAALLLALAACERAPEQVTVAASKAEPAVVIGNWRAAETVVHDGGGVTVETRESRTDYRPDGSFGYLALLRVSGGRLSADGLDFSMDASGRWSLAGTTLQERFTAVSIKPQLDAEPQLETLAKVMSDEALARPLSRSELVSAEPGRVVLRDAESGRTVTYLRLPR